jgi:predicted dehydrogenase/nucleoside-diphosphate-sugar epimerase
MIWLDNCQDPALSHLSLTELNHRRMDTPISSSKPLRVALVGAGQMAQHHARSIARLGGLAEVTAVCEPAAAALEPFKQLAPNATGYQDLRAALKGNSYDVVHVVTPPDTHEGIALQALEAGCHIYVEKPFVETARAAQRLLDLAARRQLKVCSGHQLLFEPPSLGMRKYLPALGDVKHVESYFSFRVVKRNPDGRAPLRDDLQLIDILPHPVYLLLDILERSASGTTELTGLEVGPSGTLQALLRRGAVTGTLVVTIEGRPVDSYLRVVGTNGSLHADFVRSTLQRNIGPGTSGIDKLLTPYRQAWQLFSGTTGSMARRFLNRQHSYPGLVEIFEAFYRSVKDNAPSPVSPDQLLGTVRVCERIAGELETAITQLRNMPSRQGAGPKVVVTGGTGLLGTEVARLLAEQGRRVRVLARREPAPWDRIPGVEYLVTDLSNPLPPDVMEAAGAVIHCAAETAGGYEQHQRNSIDATEHILRSASQAGIRRLVYVSSISVMAQPTGGKLVDESSRLEAHSRELGPYAWGKTMAEQLASRLAAELGIDLCIVRPGAFVDYRRFESPGLLGKRIGNIFVAIGSPRHPLAVADVGFSARTLIWLLDHPGEALGIVHLFEPSRPTKASLVERLRGTNPDLSVVWLPMLVVIPLSWTAILLQKLLRPGKPALNIAKTFARQHYDYALIQRLEPLIDGDRGIQSRANPASDLAESTQGVAASAPVGESMRLGGTL